MPAPGRIASTLTALAAIGALLAAGAANAATARACGGATDALYRATDLAVAQRIAANERSGAAVTRAEQAIASDATLAAAVAAGNLATVHAQLIELLYNGEHIVRIRVLHGGQVLDDVGGANVLAPSDGTLRVGAKVVGSFEFSVQDDLGYQLLAQRLIGAQTVISYNGQTVLANVEAGARALPDRGTITLAGTRYLVASIEAGRFPSGTLHIALLFEAPVAALAMASCEQVRADVLGAIAERIYAEAIKGPGIAVAQRAIALDGTLAAGLAAGDAAGVRAAAPALLLAAHVSRLQVLSGQRVLADVGTRSALVAPVPVAVTDAAGADVGTVLISIQSVDGLYALTSYLTQAFVLVRQGSDQLVGQRRGPTTLPASGPLAYGGARFSVFSFQATRFPAGSLTITLLVADA